MQVADWPSKLCLSVTRGPGRPCSVSGSPQKGPGEEWLCFALFCLHYLRSYNLALWGRARHPGEEAWQGVGRPGLAARLLPVLFLASCPAVQPQQMLQGMFLKMKNKSRVSCCLSGSVTDKGARCCDDAATVGVGERGRQCVCVPAAPQEGRGVLTSLAGRVRAVRSLRGRSWP